MSKKYLKREKAKFRKPKINKFMLNEMMGIDNRSEKVIKDAETVTDLILDGTLNPEKIEDYKHVKAIARTLDWSAHRLFKAIEGADVAEVLKNEKNEKKELENEDN